MSKPESDTDLSRAQKEEPGFPLIGAVFIFFLGTVGLCFLGALISMLFSNAGAAAFFGMCAFTTLILGGPICLLTAVGIAFFAPNARI